MFPCLFLVVGLFVELNKNFRLIFVKNKPFLSDCIYIFSNGGIV